MLSVNDPGLNLLTAPDGKLHDAYVSFLHPVSSSAEVASFAMQVLPEKLEKQHGYSLYIRGRDDCPGEGLELIRWNSKQVQLLPRRTFVKPVSNYFSFLNDWADIWYTCVKRSYRRNTTTICNCEILYIAPFKVPWYLFCFFSYAMDTASTLKKSTLNSFQLVYMTGPVNIL